MLAGTAILVLGLAMGVFLNDYTTLLALWLLLGIGYSLTQTPSGRLLRRSSSLKTGLPCLPHSLLYPMPWLVTYPLAGWVGATISIQTSFIALTIIAGLSLIVVWLSGDLSMMSQSSNIPIQTRRHNVKRSMNIHL
jgi:hypothetical protein